MHLNEKYGRLVRVLNENYGKLVSLLVRECRKILWNSKKKKKA